MVRPLGAGELGLSNMGEVLRNFQKIKSWKVVSKYLRIRKFSVVCKVGHGNLRICK